MNLGQEPDEFLYEVDIRRERLNACDLIEGSTGRQCEDIILQALPPEYERIRTIHLEKPGFGIADIHRMMSAIYTANLARSSSTTWIAGHGAAMPGAEDNRRNLICHYCERAGHFENTCALRAKHGLQRQQREQRNEQQNQQQSGRRQLGRKRRSKTLCQTLCSMVRCLLVDSGLPPKLWEELMLTVAYLCSRMPHSGLDMETSFKRLYGKEDTLSHLKIIGARAFVHIKDAMKLQPKSWEGMLCGFSEDEALSYRVWNPKTCRVMESRYMTFIDTPPHLTPQPIRLSPLRELPREKLVDAYASTDDLLRDVRDYTAVLDFNVNIPDEHAIADSMDGSPGLEPILEQIRDVTSNDPLISPGESSSGEASSVETLPGRTLPEVSSPSSAPDPMPASDQAAPAPSPTPSPAPSEAAARRTARPAPRSKPALTRARAENLPPRRQARSGTASLAALFE